MKVDYPLDKSFILLLRKMVSRKSETYQDEFFSRIHILNDYLNMAGLSLKDPNTAVGIILQMDLENREGIWGEEEVNE